MKKLVLIALSACLPFTLNAMDGQTAANVCAHLSAACQELAGCCEEDENCVYLPIEKCCHWGSLTVYGEYLYWKVFQDDLHFAIDGVNPGNTAQGRIYQHNGEWESGFRVGASIFFPCSAWRLGGDWLRLRSHQEEVALDPLAPLNLRATRGTPDGLDELDSASSEFQLDLDSYRVTLQVPLFTRTHVSLEPIVALRGDMIEEQFSIDYDGTGTAVGTYSNKINYWGVGPEVGLEMKWYLLPCFSLFGRSSIAGIYGPCEVEQIQFSTGTLTSDDLNVKNRFDRLQPIYGATIGLQWEGIFFRCLFMTLRFAWETQVWEEFNTTYQFFNTTQEGAMIETEGDLYTTGITARLGLSF